MPQRRANRLLIYAGCTSDLVNTSLTPDTAAFYPIPAALPPHRATRYTICRYYLLDGARTRKTPHHTRNTALRTNARHLLPVLLATCILLVVGRAGDKLLRFGML